MKKLELKHIAPYLVHGLEWEVVSRGNFTTSPDEVKKEKMTMENISLFLSKKAYKRLSCKPILRPLSQLTQEIEHNGGKFVPVVELLKIKNKTWFKEHENTRYQEIDFNDSYNISSACFAYMATKNIEIWKHDLKNQPYWIIEKLFEWHFDVFGLIEQKLAIEKL